MLAQSVPMRCGQADRNQSNEAVNGAASQESEILVVRLTEESERQRMAELFSDGSGVPAVPPEQPPPMEKATIELCMLATQVSIGLDRCTPAVAARLAPEAAGALRQWGLDAPR